MFIVGMELDVKVLKNRASDAVVISHASILFPFTLGMVLSYFIYQHFAPASINFLSFALFIGISMSITAFPVLARIVQERSLSKTRLGAIAITCAAADDITAWCLLAAVIAVVKAGSAFSALFTLVLALTYVWLMLRVIRPFLRRLGDKYSNKESLSRPVVAIFFITLLLSACASEMIGIHALFGAFMAGVIMPDNMRFRNIFIEKIEDVALVLLLPLFFVFTGLRTQIGLLNDAYAWSTCGLILAVAVGGKFLGSALAARFVGQSWRDSLSLGALMNTRGLMELIVLNIGYDLGILNPQIFTMLVLMALATTFMTGPALTLVQRLFPDRSGGLAERIGQAVKYNVLVSFSTPEKGISMLKLAGAFVKRSMDNATVTMMHLSPSNELNQYNLEEYERDSFEPVEQASQQLHLPVISLFKPSANIEEEIVEIANSGHFDLLLVGLGRSVFEGTLLGKILGFTTKIINPERLYGTLTGRERLFEQSFFDDRAKSIIRSSDVPLGVYVDKGSGEPDNVFIPVFSISDAFLLIYAQKLIHNNGSRVVILDVSGVIRQNPEMKEAIRSIEQVAPNHIALYHERRIEREFLDQQNLMMISLDSWKKAVASRSIWLSGIPSALIIKP
jgi:Kef-type K+ transport system membrane component KefB